MTADEMREIMSDVVGKGFVRQVLDELANERSDKPRSPLSASEMRTIVREAVEGIVNEKIDEKLKHASLNLTADLPANPTRLFAPPAETSIDITELKVPELEVP